MCSRSHAATRSTAGSVARAVVLPQPAEAPQLALEVAVGIAREALQAARPPVDGVDLDERVDELLADAPALAPACRARAAASLVTHLAVRRAP